MRRPTPRSVPRWAAGLLLSGLLLGGCGPVMYTAETMPAARMVEQARQADADEHAPYEFHYAVVHLDKAREEAAEANYQDAVRFAERAQEYATKARDLARRRLREMGR